MAARDTQRVPSHTSPPSGASPLPALPHALHPPPNPSLPCPISHARTHTDIKPLKLGAAVGGASSSLGAPGPFFAQLQVARAHFAQPNLQQPHEANNQHRASPTPGGGAGVWVSPGSPEGLAAAQAQAQAHASVPPRLSHTVVGPQSSPPSAEPAPSKSATTGLKRPAPSSNGAAAEAAGAGAGGGVGEGGSLPPIFFVASGQPSAFGARSQLRISR